MVIGIWVKLHPPALYLAQSFPHVQWYWNLVTTGYSPPNGMAVILFRKPSGGLHMKISKFHLCPDIGWNITDSFGSLAPTLRMHYHLEDLIKHSLSYSHFSSSAMVHTYQKNNPACFLACLFFPFWVYIK